MVFAERFWKRKERPDRFHTLGIARSEKEGRRPCGGELKEGLVFSGQYSLKKRGELDSEDIFVPRGSA